MLAARWLNARGSVGGMRLALVAAALLTFAASAAAFAGPWQYVMQPTVHVYPAIVWILVIWVLAHAAVGIVMQLYCLARSFAGYLTSEYDLEIHVVALYWHFLAITAVVTFAVIGLFPKAM
jgi:cytochrome c oxidase subunit I+III